MVKIELWNYGWKWPLVEGDNSGTVTTYMKDTIGDYWGQLGTIGDYWGLLGTIVGD